MANRAALEIDPDIRQASTLPAWCYSDPDTTRAAIDRIFAPGCAGLAQAIDYGGYRTECIDRSVLQLGIAAEGEPCFAPPPGSPDHGARIAAYYWWLFPNTMLNFHRLFADAMRGHAG